jgi:hypothetical protein
MDCGLPTLWVVLVVVDEVEELEEVDEVPVVVDDFAVPAPEYRR